MWLSENAFSPNHGQLHYWGGYGTLGLYPSRNGTAAWVYVIRNSYPTADYLQSLRDRGSIQMDLQGLLHAALEEARLGLREGGLPIGSVLADPEGRIVARGHNLRVQSGDPTAHAEVVCIRHAGRRRDWPQLSLVSTLSPCVMCTGTSLLYKIPRVVIGENQNFLGAEDLFREHGVSLTVLQDPACIQMMRDFIREHADLWNEDIGN
jgi:creatinine deaminase